MNCGAFMKGNKTAFILNICIFVFVAFAITWMMIGISSGPFADAGFLMLRYFTVDSNIIMGLFALIAAIDEWKVLKGKKQEVSVSSYVLKLTGTVSVTLTMLVTVFFLLPTTAAELGPFALFYGSNFFLHLFNPILSILCFIRFEKTNRIPFRLTFVGIVPMVLYAVYYVAETLTHIRDGAIMEGYDWYGFFFAGISSVLIVVPILVLITWGISFALWKLNRRPKQSD